MLVWIIYTIISVLMIKIGLVKMVIIKKAHGVTSLTVGVLAAHTITLHTVILHTTPSIGTSFLDIVNKILLSSESLIVPTNQHETFQYNLSLFTRFVENFLEGHHPIISPSITYLIVEFLSDELPKIRCILLVQVVPVNSFKSSLTLQSHTCTTPKSFSFRCVFDSFMYPSYQKPIESCSFSVPHLLCNGDHSSPLSTFRINYLFNGLDSQDKLFIDYHLLCSSLLEFDI